MASRAAGFYFSKEVEGCGGRILVMKLTDFKPWKTYLVNIKLDKSNVVHRSLLTTEGYKIDGEWFIPDEVEIYNPTYEKIITKRWQDIHWFEIVQEIEMETELFL